MQVHSFLFGKLSWNRRKQINQSNQVCEQLYNFRKESLFMDMTQNDLESLIKRNRMQHFKCFTISSFVIKVLGTHTIKLFTLLVAHRLWSHKEVSIITLFDFASWVCGMLLDCTQEWGPETLSLGLLVWPYASYKHFWTTQRSSYLKVTGQHPAVLDSRQTRAACPCKHTVRGIHQRARPLWPAGYPIVSKE